MKPFGWQKVPFYTKWLHFKSTLYCLYHILISAAKLKGNFLERYSKQMAPHSSTWKSCLENPMGRGFWWAAVHGVARSRIRLNDFTLTFHFHALEKEMATHSSVLAWRIPGTGEPDGLPSMGLHRVGHD